MMGYLTENKVLYIFSHFDTLRECYRRTRGRTDGHAPADGYHAYDA